MKSSNKKGLKLKIIKKPLFYIPATILLGIIVIGLAGIIIWKPGIVRGEYSIQSIVDMLLNHDKRISDIEKKTDETQTQTNQNSADIDKLQENTDTAPADTVPTVTTPITTSNPIIETPTETVTPTTPTPNDPNEISWTNSHGTFVYKNIPSNMYTGKDKSILFS